MPTGQDNDNNSLFGMMLWGQSSQDSAALRNRQRVDIGEMVMLMLLGAPPGADGKQGCRGGNEQRSASRRRQTSRAGRAQLHMTRSAD